jgi:hypothetical protein
MKTKLLSLFTLCVFFIGCSVDPIEEELNTSVVSELETVDVTADYGCAGPDNSKEITVAAAKAIGSWDEVRKLYISMLGASVPKNGTFDPTIWDIIKQFNQQANPIGSYTTTYSVNSNSCTDSVILTLHVVEKLTPPCTVTAGADGSKKITLSEAKALGSWDEVRKLYLSMLETGISRNGTFAPSIDQLIKDYGSRSNKLGEYPTTYTVKEGDCSDSTELKMIIVENKIEDPVCTLNAGPDNLKELTVAQAKALGSWDEVRKLYLSLLQSGVSRTGTFSPSIDAMIKSFNSKSNPVGDYSLTYTIKDGDCSDSVNLTLRVK